MDKLCPQRAATGCLNPAPSHPSPFFGFLGAELQRSTLLSASGSAGSLQRGDLCGYCVAPATSFSESAAAFASDPGFQGLK